MGDATNLVTNRVLSRHKERALLSSISSYFWPRWNSHVRQGVSSPIFSTRTVDFLIFVQPSSLKFSTDKFVRVILLSRCSHHASFWDARAGFCSVLWAVYVSGIKTFVYEYNASYSFRTWSRTFSWRHDTVIMRWRLGKQCEQSFPQGNRYWNVRRWRTNYSLE